MSPIRRAAVIFDVDGTLVDSNDAHARVWVAAFAQAGITVAYEPVRRASAYRGASELLDRYEQSILARLSRAA